MWARSVPGLSSWRRQGYWRVERRPPTGKSARNLPRATPGVHIAPDRIFVRDGNVYSSAGVTAGMDLALALVEEDLGQTISLKVAQELVMFVRRPGGQSQISALLKAQVANRQPIRELALWMAEHPASDFSIEALAARVHMSARNFSRTFRPELGQTPARFAEALRVEAARRMFEETEERMDHIARECGFGSGNSMLHSFWRILGHLPSQYRERSTLRFRATEACPVYSSRRTNTGSTQEARRAGIQQAATATRASTSATAAKVPGSVGRTP